MRMLKITMGSVELQVELLDTPTAAALYAAAPISDVMQPGEIAFWMAGNCIAIPFGPTPVSVGDELRLASAANVWGRAVEDVKILAPVRPGDAITVERTG